jgi:asparagine synthetase B (glutamine-hydrolysing)
MRRGGRSIIDLSPTGRQPMADESGQLQIVFNGEICIPRDVCSSLLALRTGLKLTTREAAA